MLETRETSFLKNRVKCLERRVNSGLFLKGLYGPSLQVMVPMLWVKQHKQTQNKKNNYLNNPFNFSTKLNDFKEKLI